MQPARAPSRSSRSSTRSSRRSRDVGRSGSSISASVAGATRPTRRVSRGSRSRTAPRRPRVRSRAPDRRSTDRTRTIARSSRRHGNRDPRPRTSGRRPATRSSAAPRRSARSGQAGTTVSSLPCRTSSGADNRSGKLIGERRAYSSAASGHGPIRPNVYCDSNLWSSVINADMSVTPNRLVPAANTSWFAIASSTSVPPELPPSITRRSPSTSPRSARNRAAATASSTSSTHQLPSSLRRYVRPYRVLPR